MNHTVEFANPADFEDLAAIWRMAFSDTDEFINTFFKTMNKDGYTLVSRESGVAVSSAFLLEAQFVIKGKPYSAYYFLFRQKKASINTMQKSALRQNFIRESSTSQKKNFQNLP